MAAGILKADLAIANDDIRVPRTRGCEAVTQGPSPHFEPLFPVQLPLIDHQPDVEGNA
jgi:hypothetical protein